MSHIVKTLKNNITLPNNVFYPLATSTALLTDDQFAQIAAADFTNGLVQDMGYYPSGDAAIAAETTRATAAEGVLTTAAAAAQTTASAALVKASNLSDLTNVAAARTSLNLGSAALLASSAVASAAGGSASTAPVTALAHRRDTQANFFTSNPTLAAGELAFETDTLFTKIGDGATAYKSLYYTRQPNVWTPASIGLIAATGDGATMPSQAAVTTGRLFLVPTRVDQAKTVNSVVSAYISAAATTTDANTFIGVYDVATGALLGQTADLSSLLTTVAGAEFVAPLTAPITGLAAGQQIYIALLNNYLVSTGPQWISTRLFGTAMAGVSGAITRLFTTTGTLSALPSTLPTLSPSGTNSIPWIGLTQ